MAMLTCCHFNIAMLTRCPVLIHARSACLGKFTIV